MNRNVSEPGWPDAPGDPARAVGALCPRAVPCLGNLAGAPPACDLAELLGRRRAGRPGHPAPADQIWVSDKTEAAARLAIQEGFSQIFPANTMEAWVTDVGADRRSLAFRFHVSMCGSLGIGGHLAHWDAARRSEAADWIAPYKEIRPIIQFGDLYRLRSPQQDPFSALEYVSKDKREACCSPSARTSRPSTSSRSSPPSTCKGWTQWPVTRSRSRTKSVPAWPGCAWASTSISPTIRAACCASKGWIEPGLIVLRPIVYMGSRIL